MPSSDSPRENQQEQEASFEPHPPDNPEQGLDERLAFWRELDRRINQGKEDPRILDEATRAGLVHQGLLWSGLDGPDLTFFEPAKDQLVPGPLIFLEWEGRFGGPRLYIPISGELRTDTSEFSPNPSLPEDPQDHASRSDARDGHEQSTGPATYRVPDGPVYARTEHGLKAYVRRRDDHRPLADETVFGPKKADHPTVGELCPSCDQPFDVGDLTVLVPLGPGGDPESRNKARKLRWYNAPALEVHLACATGERMEDYEGAFDEPDTGEDSE